MKQLAAILLLFALLASCTNDNKKETINIIENAIKKDFMELSITDFSYIITTDSKILKTHFQSLEDERFLNSSAIIENFTAPLALKQLIDYSLIDKDTLLAKYIPTFKDRSLTVSNLLTIHANQTKFNYLESGYITNHIVKLLKIKHIESSTKYLDINIKEEKNLNDKDVLTALAKISLYFDSKNITGHLPVDSLIPNLYPNWYTRNIVYFAGWKVLNIDGHIIFWNFFTQGHKSLLLIKAINEGISIAITYPSKNIPSPYDDNKSDLLQSPLATTFLKSLLVSVGAANNEKEIEKQLSCVKSSKLNFLFMHDLIARARANELAGRSAKADSLYHLYEKNFPNAIPVKYLKQPVLVEFDYVSDNFDGKRYFELKEDTKVRLFGSGQFSKDIEFENHLNIKDCIELYLDTYNRKSQLLDISKNEYLYRFNYGYNKISGNYLSNKNIDFAYGDPNDSVYILEVKMPWQTLSDRKPKIGETLGFNTFVIDNDNNEKWWWKSLLSWSTREWWNASNNPSKWGNLILTGDSKHDKPKIAYCTKTSHAIKIDGQIDPIWNKTNYVSIDTIGGRISSKRDNSGSFKTMWDNQSIYFLFYIVDNIKNTAGIVKSDKGWIENSTTAEVVYEMTGPSNTTFFPSFSTDKTFTLKAGKYFLRYTSDGGHSVEKWYGKSPQNYMYGAVLYKSID